MMKRTLWVLPVVFCVLFAASPAYCINSYYVDYANGNDSNIGDFNHPLKTIPTAVSKVSAGDTIYLRGGRHYYDAKISISKIGSASARYNMFAYPGDANRPVLDFSAMAYDSGNRGISLSGSYWYMKGFDIYDAGDNGLNISGSNNIIEFCAFYENRDGGCQLGGGAANNQIINCDSYYNYDPPDGGDADGFSPKLTVGTGNYFKGCRSWQNSDDGFDAFLTTSDDVTTTYENCWAFKNGYLKDGITPSGNGNGFKMGSANLRHNAILKNCLAFQNLAKGFDQNHNLGSMMLYNCTAYNNEDKNYSIYDTLTAGKTAKLENCVHYTGTNNLGTFVVLITDSWRPPFAVNSADFVSIDPAAAYGPRQADGNLPVITFMHLASTSDLIDGGTIDANIGLPYYGSKPDLGCFEYIPAGSPPGQATGPVPSNGLTNVGLTQDLSWTAGSGATSRDVFFGTVNPPVTKVIADGTVLTYDTGTMVSLTTYYWRIDEKNAYGTTTGAVWSFTTQDADTPLPNPMEWATLPAAAGTGSITMSAATATDLSGVEYYFANVSDSNHDSGWQDSNEYTDTGLTRSTAYTYMVKARDKSIYHNETGWSDTAAAMTLRYDCTSPITSDLNGDCQVDLFDFARFADAWANDLPEADLHSDSILDLLDVAQFADDWLTCNRDPDTECWQ